MNMQMRFIQGLFRNWFLKTINLKKLLGAWRWGSLENFWKLKVANNGLFVGTVIHVKSRVLDRGLVSSRQSNELSSYLVRQFTCIPPVTYIPECLYFITLLNIILSRTVKASGCI